MSINSAASAASNSLTPTAISSATSSAGISSSDFLNLLVGELQNQDPLDPTDTSDFVNQMSQYANFDQEQTLNSNLGLLLTSFNSLLTLNSINYVGHTVEAKGDTATLQNGQASFGYDLTSAASQVNLSIQDASGTTVWSGSGPAKAGLNAFSWDGVGSDGTQYDDGGQYTLNVSALDASGNSVLGYTTTFGTVTDVDNSSGNTVLDVNGVAVNVTDIVAVR